MASRELYPPIVDSYQPAFKPNYGQLNYSTRIYFRLSKFNSNASFKNVHVSIVKQDTNMNVVNLSDNTADKRYRATGIILNAPSDTIEENSDIHYVDIYNDDLATEFEIKTEEWNETEKTVDTKTRKYRGWCPGWIYKIQIRLSNATYDGSIGQNDWLNKNADSFSEWSTVCVIKAVGRIDYTLCINDNDPISTEYQNSSIQGQILKTNATTVDIVGSFSRKEDPSELIKSYKFILYDNDDNIIEDTGDIYANQYQNNDNINYTLTSELQDGNSYKLAFIYTTINEYKDGFYKYDNVIDYRWIIQCEYASMNLPRCELLIADNDVNGILRDVTSIDKEEDEGRIAIKLYSKNNSKISTNFCIRRADSRDNFLTWRDVYICVCNQQTVNELPLFYDYTIESGVWYKYGVQEIDIKGHKDTLFVIPKPVMRNFNYSFILGKDNRQLRLQFNNTIPNFKYQVSESKQDPIGSKYTKVTRNAITKYRTFSLNGLISFWMDEDNLFTSKKELYYLPRKGSTHGEDDIVSLYDNYNLKNHIMQYDYIYEKDFRNKVLEFLQDGEPKLFKSPTEGNIIIRLMDVNCTPNQSTDRMIYNFSANAHEIDEANMINYTKYEFYKVGTYATSFATNSLKLGQLSKNFEVKWKITEEGKTEITYPNIIKEICDKYQSQEGKNIAGYVYKIKNIRNLKITFDGKPLRVKDSKGQLALGHNFIYKNQLFTVNYPIGMYQFDERIQFNREDTLELLNDFYPEKETVVTETNKNNWTWIIPATIDFLYEIEIESFVDPRSIMQHVKKGFAQFCKECFPQEDIYNKIFNKHFINWSSYFRRLVSLSSIEIEANPGACFIIKDDRDEDDTSSITHMVGATGQLYLDEIENIVDIRYIGMKDANGNLQSVKTDVIINYYYITNEGSY